MHPLRWPWLTLIACAAASGNLSAQTVAPADTAARTDSESAETEREWRLPPLRLTGSLSFDTRATRSDSGGASWSSATTLTLNTNTYLYQPWLATVNATLGLSGSWSSSDSTGFADAGVHERVRSKQVFVTGAARVDLFPRSRFPADIHWERQDSRSSSGLLSPIAYTRQNIGLSLRYQPPDGSYHVSGAADHSSESSGSVSQWQDSFSADFSKRWKQHDVNIGGSFSRARRDGSDEESRFTSLVGRHAFTPSSALSVNTTANITRSEEHGAGHSDQQVLQVSSVAFYRPDKAPYTLTGSVRGVLLRDPTSGLENDSFGATLGVNYEVTPKLRVSANGGLNYSQSPGSHGTSLNGAVSATYQGDSHEFAGFRHDWHTGASLGASMGESTSQERALSQQATLQVGHALTRSWSLGERSSLGFSASQSVSAAFARSDRAEEGGAESSKSLLNSLSLNWQQGADGRTAFARASYSDTVELGGGRGRFQMFNFQLSGNMDLGYGRSVSGDFGYQVTQQRQSALTTLNPGDALGLRTRTSGFSGEIQFQQTMLFGVPRLRFVSRLRLAQDVLKQPGQLLSFPDRETRLWESRLDWTIGRLDTQLVLRLSDVDGRRVDSVWLRVNRSFGN